MNTLCVDVLTLVLDACPESALAAFARTCRAGAQLVHAHGKLEKSKQQEARVHAASAMVDSIVSRKRKYDSLPMYGRGTDAHLLNTQLPRLCSFLKRSVQRSARIDYVELTINGVVTSLYEASHEGDASFHYFRNSALDMIRSVEEMQHGGQPARHAMHVCSLDGHGLYSEHLRLNEDEAMLMNQTVQCLVTTNACLRESIITHI